MTENCNATQAALRTRSSSIFYGITALRQKVNRNALQDSLTFCKNSARTLKPWLGMIFVGAYVSVSAVYCFWVGRDRYQSISEFVIRQPLPPNSSGSSLLSPALGSPTILGSLEDGRYLQAYLGSYESMRRLYPSPGRLELLYAPNWTDPFTGLRRGANRQQILQFYQRQQSVVPQELSGSVVIATNGYTPLQAHELNRSLLAESQRFVNIVNQRISSDQLRFAESEVVKARLRLDRANKSLNLFQARHGQLNAVAEQDATTTYLAALESRLVDLKVQEASLRRQFRDPQAPEVVYVADQVRELKEQIAEERRKAVNPGERDLNRLAIQAQNLQNEVTFASDALKASMLAADNSRIESQRQLKFLIMLRDPVLPSQPESSWRWKAFLASVGGLMVVWGVGGFLIGVAKRS
ncbi:sugar ABC transporter [Vulcanococcus sp. Clear-D1]|uniref:sugar ABC transporter n=1 Tax=Vulcanococcus sp. Clear-D1 TaxID=2766970 RepID=UPI0019905910|nr:sugar ABC transporter [Vulcanococcus sp. Clear-D1]MBD1194988.1 sugar ABC transporter [Vulcanococcus sp. Clear-D1]